MVNTSFSIISHSILVVGIVARLWDLELRDLGFVSCRETQFFF
jgi:hypothetical protein